MTDKTETFDVYLNTEDTGILKVANAVLFEKNNRLFRFGWRYTPEFLNHPNRFALHPSLPLGEQINQSCHDLPGILSDFLPDSWGRRVIAKVALHHHHVNISAQSPIDIIQYMSASQTGAIQWVPAHTKPNYELGNHVSLLLPTEQEAECLEKGDRNTPVIEYLHLANSGSGAGGARPKALVYDDDGAYLAKFNLSNDAYSNAHVEAATLAMAKHAGIESPDAKVVELVKPCLLVGRFDVTNDLQYRKHLVSLNSLLRNPHTYDEASTFSYSDIADLIQEHSTQVIDDSKLLLRQMLFNEAINNTDDHDRNFSFLVDSEGYRLAPAYDMVPQMSHGQFHAAGFNYSMVLPEAKELANHPRKIFGLAKGDVQEIAEQIVASVKQWPQFAEAVGMREADAELIDSMLPKFGESYSLQPM